MLLRKLVDNGHTILRTVHQPSAQLFGMFDQLLLLKDGNTLYYGGIGDRARHMVEYFESKGARKCLPEENPAEWMLQMTESSTKSSEVETTWAQEWQLSRERKELSEKVQDLSIKTPISNTTHASGERRYEFATSLTRQISLLVRRVFTDQWRNPTYLYTKTAACVCLVSFHVPRTRPSRISNE